MILLLQFLLRLAFGLSAGMAMTSPRQVSSGYYRNHMYVVLGLTTLAALLSHTRVPAAFLPAMMAIVICYIGSVCWLYEKPRMGRATLVLVAGLAFAAAWLATPPAPKPVDVSQLNVPIPGGLVHALRWLATISSGLLLGITMAAMLLGHWYLNSPTMDLAPLRRLLKAMAWAVVLQVVISSLGLWGAIHGGLHVTTQWVLFLALRWTFGLLGVGAMVWMAWQTLKIPNTQSATGILYVAVIGTFVGETMALLLSVESVDPL